jgi:hypothetical protein
MRGPTVGAIPVLQWREQGVFPNLPPPSRLVPATGRTKVELLVIVVQPTTVNLCPGLVLTARQALGVGSRVPPSWPWPPHGWLGWEGGSP